MNLCTIIALMILIGGITVSPASGKNEKAYVQAMSLKIAYVAKDGGVLTVTLTNISDATLDLILNTKEVEGEFSIEGSKEKEGSFYDEDYLRKLVTSRWFSGVCELEPKQTVTWSVKLDELVYFGADDSRVTHASLAGKSFSLKLDRLAVVPAPKESNIPVDLRSNVVTIPAPRQK